MANAALASRKDLRDAVVAARKGYAAWSKATAYNRGQVIYRMAEMLEGRQTEFVELIMTQYRRLDQERHRRSRCQRSIVWCTTPAGPTSSPQCSGAPTRSRALTSPTPLRKRPAWLESWRHRIAVARLVAVIAPVITGGNACVVIAAEQDPCVAITFAEVVATSDVPPGVINILTGRIVGAGSASCGARGCQRSGSHGRRCRAARVVGAGSGRYGEAGLCPAKACRTSRQHLAPRDCAPSLRSRQCGIPRAPYPSPAARLTSQVVSVVESYGSRYERWLNPLQN